MKSKKTLLSIVCPLLIGLITYLVNFFTNTFPNSQASIRLLEAKYDRLGEDIREIKETQKDFSRDQKNLINFLLERKNVTRKNRKYD